MIKVGIKTFYDANNYGAVVQAYALRKTIEDEGYNCCVLFNETDSIRKRYLIKYPHNSLRSFIVAVVVNYFLIKKQKKFEQFREKYLSISLYNESFNIVVAGSDQIWNKDIIGSDMSFFLDFVMPTTRKVAYAPSFGKENVEDSELIAQRLLSFDSLSIREKEGQNVINKLLCMAPPVVLDPTFLCSKQEWIRVFSLEKPLIKKRYILCYVFSMDSDTKSFVRKLAKEKQCDVICVANNLFEVKDKFIYKRSAGPEEWLNYILHAEYIVTNSFHGTALSIIFEKQFYIGRIHNEDTRCRIDNILDILGIKGRFFGGVDSKAINYEAVNKVLALEIQKSKQYLINALEE